MATPKAEQEKKHFKDYATAEASWWCPGCGDFGVLAALQRAFANLGLENEDVAVVTGIGCSGKLSGYTKVYGYHSLHGRALPAASAIKLANKDLTVVAAGGDGDGYGIGVGHFIHAIRRNIDVTYVVMDNQIYGLTKGQTSPTSSLGFVTGTTPEGNVDTPVNPLALAMGAGVTFLAQAFSGDMKGMMEIIQKGIEHEGFSLINVFSPCVTFNKKNTYAWYRDVLVDLDEVDHDPSSREDAWKAATSDAVYKGLIYQEKRPSYHNLVPGLRDAPLATLDIENKQGTYDYEKILQEFK